MYETRQLIKVLKMMIIMTLCLLGVCGVISGIFCLLERKWYTALLSFIIPGLVVFFAVRDIQGVDETVFNDCRVVAHHMVDHKLTTRVQLPNGNFVNAEGIIPNATQVNVKMREYPLSGNVEYEVVIEDELTYEVKLGDPQPPLPSE